MINVLNQASLAGLGPGLLAAEKITLNQSMATAAYIVAAVLFILSLAGLSNQSSARRGNALGIAGMLLAIAATVFGVMQGGFVGMTAAIIPAVIIGAVLAARVPMTGMPELVAMLHSFVGLAAVFVGISSHLHPGIIVPQGEKLIHDIEIFVGVFIDLLATAASLRLLLWRFLGGIVITRARLLILGALVMDADDDLEHG